MPGISCTGGPSCAECNKLGERCLYTDQRRKSRVQRNGPQGTTSDNGLSANVMQMNARLEELEAHCLRLKTFISSAAHAPFQPSPQSDFAANLDPLLTGSPFDEPIQIPASPARSAPTAGSPVPTPIPNPAGPSHSPPPQQVPAPLDPPPPPSQPHRAVSAEEDSLSIDLPAIPPHEMISRPTLVEVAGILESLGQSAVSPVRPTPGGINLARARQQVSRNNGASIRPSFDIFFRLLNPLHPILNENQFRAQFDNLVFHEGQALSELDRLQFLALVLLVYAEVTLLNSPSSDPANVCGWDEFCAAESILADIIWKDAANLLTVQCLLIKTRYLTYLQRLHQAHDTMAVVVRLCLMIGLHDQARWALQGVDDVEVVMR